MHKLCSRYRAWTLTHNGANKQVVNFLWPDKHTKSHLYVTFVMLICPLWISHAYKMTEKRKKGFELLTLMWLRVQTKVKNRLKFRFLVSNSHLNIFFADNGQYGIRHILLIWFCVGFLMYNGNRLLWFLCCRVKLID